MVSSGVRLLSGTASDTVHVAAIVLGKGVVTPLRGWQGVNWDRCSPRRPTQSAHSSPRWIVPVPRTHDAGRARRGGLCGGVAEELKRLNLRAYPGREVHVACDDGEFYHCPGRSDWSRSTVNEARFTLACLYTRSVNPVQWWRRHQHAAFTDVFREKVDEFTVNFKISVARINGSRS